MKGPGKYDPEVTTVRERTGAAFVAIIVLGGDRGDGFSVQCVNPGLLHEVPRMLRHMADEMELTLAAADYFAAPAEVKVKDPK